MTDDRLPPLGRGASVRTGRFEIRRDGSTWTVDVDYLDLDEKVRVYRDGELVGERESPARFDTEVGRIEARIGDYGMEHVRLVTEEGTETLRPVEGTGEAERAAFARRHPVADRVVAVLAWIILACALVLELPELISFLARLVGADVDWGLELPWPLRVLIVVLGVAAAIDRALRLKRNPLLDE